MQTASPPPSITFDDPTLVTLDEAVDLRLVYTTHGLPASRNTIRRWADEGHAGIRIPTRQQRIGTGYRAVTTPAALAWFDLELAKRRHPRLADRLEPTK